MLLLTPIDSALAFNVATHHQIVKSALSYLQTHITQEPLTAEWLGLAERNQSNANIDPMERFLVRSVIDADYQDDLWLDAWYYKPFSGGKTDTFGMLTSLYHFTNVTKPGQYWRYDGYAYKNTDGLGNDAFLGLTGLDIRVDLSWPMQKYASHQSDGPMADVTLPPSYLIAIDAFEAAISPQLSLSSHREVWDKELTYADSYVFTSGLTHRYAIEEIAGLPARLQKLGTTLHMAQDLAMPHHAQGIAGLCHTQLETYIDGLICGTAIKTPDEIYDSGFFDEVAVPPCQELNDVEEVEKLIADNPIFDVHSSLSLEERLIQIAKISAELKVHPQPDKDENAMIITRAGQTLFSGSCNDIHNSKAMHRIAHTQYQLATAASIMIIEYAAFEFARRTKRLGNLMQEQCERCESSQMSC